MSVTVYPAKFWPIITEPLRYGDLDDAGHVIIKIDPNTIGTIQINATAIATKVANLGGAGLKGQYVLPKNRVLASSARTVNVIATVGLDGCKTGDSVVVGPLLLAATNAPVIVPTPPATALPSIYYFGNVPSNNTVKLYASSMTGNDILLAGSRLNFRVFTF